MLTFSPMVRTDGYVTLSYEELWRRLGTQEQVDKIAPALASGDLTAFVQLDGDFRFYRVPSEHWNRESPFLEGQPGDTLFCWGSSNVPFQFCDRPLLFFLDQVEKWEGSFNCDRKVEDIDTEAFADCYARAGTVREGYWSPYVTLAWIAGRDERFVAAVQLFEQENYANRGGLFSSAAWLCLGDEAGERFGVTFSGAEQHLIQALEANKLPGGVATNAGTGQPRPIERHEWTAWNRTFEYVGLMLLPGFVKFLWPSECVRAAFPATIVSKITAGRPGSSGSFDPSQTPPMRFVHSGRGRRRGTGIDDSKHLEEMRQAVAKGEAPWKSAGDISARLSKDPDRALVIQKRLSRKYRQNFP